MSSVSRFVGISGEIQRRELIKNYAAFTAYTNPDFIMTKFHKFICNQAQEFLEVRTGKALDILLLSVPPRHGKGASKDTLVWTPDGWKKHGDLKVGDRVYGQNGDIKRVTFVHPDYCLDEYEVTFKTGEKVRVSPQHLWPLIYTNRGTKPAHPVHKLVETQNIFKQGRYLIERSPKLAVNQTLDGDYHRLYIDPYRLGLWLGDGYSHTGSVCGDIDDLIEYNIGEVTVLPARKNFGVVNNVIGLNVLRHYNLYKNKHIPVEYLTADPDSRFELLMGLMDTDGNISRSNPVCEICLANKTLARDVYTLVRSLGYKAQFIERLTHNQTEDFEGTAYRIIWRPENGDELFRLNRKQIILDGWRDSPYNDQSIHYYVKSVEKVAEKVVGNCIMVEGDGTYLITENLIPTHNSYSITETLPAWFLGNNPRGEVILCSYQSTIAESFSRPVRDKFNEYCDDIFHIKPNVTAQTKEYWETETGGKCRAAGLDAGITRYGAELFIIDDPIKNAQEAGSEVVIKKILAEMGPSVQSRIYPGGKLIVIQTRWVENDVVGFIKDNWSEFIWKDINLPCEYDEVAAAEGPCPLGRKLGDSLMGPHLGDPILPTKINNDNLWLQSKKRIVISGEGQKTWNSLYQGRPSGATGNTFDETWFGKFKQSEFVTERQRESLSPRELTGKKVFEYLQLSIDATFKDTEKGSFVAMGLRGIYKGKIYLYHQLNKRMGFVETMEKIKWFNENFPEIDELVIEDKANGSAIADMLRYEEKAPSVVMVDPKGGKASRAEAISYHIKNGIYLIAEDMEDNVDWHIATTLGPREKIVAQFKSFPYGKHDDMVDECSQGMIRLIKLITGEEPRPERRYLRYTKWYPDMWEDFEQMTAAEQEKFIYTYGAPEEWYAS